MQMVSMADRVKLAHQDLLDHPAEVGHPVLLVYQEVLDNQANLGLVDLMGHLDFLEYVDQVEQLVLLGQVVSMIGEHFSTDNYKLN